tara:strand:- start:323 stop:721 length:399 start_codon:yes stop_codon:yes gene_type:complete
LFEANQIKIIIMSEKTNAGKGLGVAGLILGILGLISAFIPCLAAWAILLCLVGIVLSAISISKANKGNGSKGIGKAGLILSIIGAVIVVVWVFVFASAMSEGLDALQDPAFQDAIKESLENANEKLENLENK